MAKSIEVERGDSYTILQRDDGKYIVLGMVCCSHATDGLRVGSGPSPTQVGSDWPYDTIEEARKVAQERQKAFKVSA